MACAISRTFTVSNRLDFLKGRFFTGRIVAQPFDL